MGDVSAHFSVSEFAQPAGRGLAGIPYPPEWIDSRLMILCAELEIIRAELVLNHGAKGITIGSGYRSPAYNKALPGTARASQHMEGRAADLVVPGVKASVVHACVLRLSQAGRLPNVHGLGFYGDRFTHVDIRPGTRLVRWNGSKARADVG